MNPTNTPTARTAGLIIKPFSDETLVYDTERAQAHCLNQTAALVWQYCDGQSSVSQIARRVQAELHSLVDEQIVWYTLQQLERYHLLQAPVRLPDELARMSRREFLRKLKVGAGIAVPVIISVSVPTAAQAASCLPSGQLCISDMQCCSGFCNFGICQ